MPETNSIFSQELYLRMQTVNPGIKDMELFEFEYALENMRPASSWETVEIPGKVALEEQIHKSNFYKSIQMKPRLGDKLVMDPKILRLSQQLFTGLVTSFYEPEWINAHFYFDIRGFYFLTRTSYLTPEIISHLGGKPFAQFEKKQTLYEGALAVGYKAFKEANAEVDAKFIEITHQLVARMGTPIVIAIAGQTAAGKTEITQRLEASFEESHHSVTSIEIDNFFTDRDERESKGVDSLGIEALHYDMFKEALHNICRGEEIITPRYDFISATSSHDLNGMLKPGCEPVVVKPADIILMEGNFPFLIPEIAQLIDIKIMYLTSDAMRMQRKWKRDMDYRKKYDLMYFLNRYFREQFLMAEEVYRPQSALCDIYVDTTGASLWLTPEFRHQIRD